MIDQVKSHSSRHVAAAAVVLAGLAFVLGGAKVGTGAVIGGVVAVIDAWAITWLAHRIVTGAGAISSGMAAGLLGVKLIALLGVCWALLSRWSVDALGFSVGLGALVVGMLYTGIELSIRETQAARRASTTGEG